MTKWIWLLSPHNYTPVEQEVIMTAEEFLNTWT